jgi:hypothetical protein
MAAHDRVQVADPDRLHGRVIDPAEPAERASVTPPLGGPERVEGVTTEFHEFEVREGFDNAEILVGAVPSTPAAIDLYLQRQAEDGSWSDDLAAGTAFDFGQEQLRLSRPEPGTYRVEAHNWLGAPNTRVDLTVTFVNSAGEPGEGA